MKNVTLTELVTLCHQWQEKLGLSHWQIAVSLCSANEMKLQDVQATSEISPMTECALISILRPEDYPESPFEQDIEVSLVHELLHIHMKYIAEPDENSLENVHLEAFIERIARLLVKLQRKGF